MSPCVRLLSPFVRKISSLSPAILACEKSARNFTIARRHWLLCRPRPKPPPPLSNLLTLPSMSRHPLLFVDVMLYRLREQVCSLFSSQPLLIAGGGCLHGHVVGYLSSLLFPLYLHFTRVFVFSSEAIRFYPAYYRYLTSMQHPVEMLKAFMRLLLVVVFPPALMVFVAAMVHGGARMDITGNDRVWLVGEASVYSAQIGIIGRCYFGFRSIVLSFLLNPRKHA